MTDSQLNDGKIQHKVLSLQAEEEATLPITPEVQHKTNLNGGVNSTDSDATPAGISNSDPSFADIIVTAISWDNFALSTILCIGGIFLALIVDYLLQGKHGLPLLSGMFN